MRTANNLSDPIDKDNTQTYTENMKSTSEQVTSREILEQTGLKSAKTLTRWYQQGIIPPPAIRTHPSGRGKIAYWPEWVVDRCLRIIQLRKDGHSLRAASTLIEKERIAEIARRGTEKEMADHLVKVTEALDAEAATPEQVSAVGEAVRRFLPRIQEFTTPESSPVNTFLALVLSEIEQLTSDRELQDAVITELHGENALDGALQYLLSGYGSVLVFNRSRFAIMADVIVGHYLSQDERASEGYYVLPLHPIVRRLFSKRHLPDPVNYPAPRFWRKEGDALVEYEVPVGEKVDLDLVRKKARRVGQVKSPHNEEGAA